MRCAIVLWTVTAAVGLATTVVAGENQAAVDEAALQAFKRGTTAFKADQYEEALQAFMQAYALKPEWKLYYNIAQSAAAAKQYGAALEAFEKYQIGGGDEIAPARIAEVQREIATLKLKVGYLTVTAPDGAEIYVDEIMRGVAPLPGPVCVNAAEEQRVRAVFADGRTVEKSFLVYSEQATSVDLTQAGPPSNDAVEGDVSPTPVDAVPKKEHDAKPPSSPKSKELFGLKVAGWVAVGVGAAALVGGAVTGGLALGKYNDLKDDCPGDVCYSDQYDEMDAKDAMATSSTVLLAVGGTAAAVGAGLLIYRQLKLKKKNESKAVSFGVAPNGVAIWGRF